eukprot:437534-Prorocentrum_minimum.AAC.1
MLGATFSHHVRCGVRIMLGATFSNHCGVARLYRLPPPAAPGAPPDWVGIDGLELSGGVQEHVLRPHHPEPILELIFAARRGAVGG